MFWNKNKKVIKYCDICNKQLIDKEHAYCDVCWHIRDMAQIGRGPFWFSEPTKKQKEQAEALYFLLLEDKIKLEDYKAKAEKLVGEYKKLQKKREENEIKKAKKIIGGI